MRARHALTGAAALVPLLLLPSLSTGQWLSQPTAGIPRAADGKPNLSAPAPRTADGKPDLSGLWHAGARFDFDLKPSDVQAWAQNRSREREANPAADSWGILCLPPGPMITFSGPLTIIHTPRATTMLYEVPNNFRSRLPKEQLVGIAHIQIRFVAFPGLRIRDFALLDAPLHAPRPTTSSGDTSAAAVTHHVRRVV